MLLIHSMLLMQLMYPGEQRVYVLCVCSFSAVDSLLFCLSLFCRHPSVQNAILANTVQWSALFLLPGSSYSETSSLLLAPILPLSVVLGLPSKPSSFRKPFVQFHCLLYDYVCLSVCIWCVRACACVCEFAACAGTGWGNGCTRYHLIQRWVD